MHRKNWVNEKICLANNDSTCTAVNVQVQ
jgi:hypothetical protein